MIILIADCVISMNLRSGLEGFYKIRGWDSKHYWHYFVPFLGLWKLICFNFDLHAFFWNILH